MQTTFRTAQEAQKAAERDALPAGLYEANVEVASEGVSNWGNPSIEVALRVADGNGGERRLKDWFTDSPVNALRLRNACIAIGAMEQYTAGEITPDLFVGRNVRVRIGIAKKRGSRFNVIEDYAASTKVVNLPRTA